MRCRRTLFAWSLLAALLVFTGGGTHGQSVVAMAQTSEMMDAEDVVLAAMDALWSRDIERHLAYLADDVVIEGFHRGQVLSGKAAYRHQLLPMLQVPDALWQQVEVQTAITDSDYDAFSNTTRVEAQMLLRHSGEYAATPDQYADLTFLARDGLIHQIQWRGRPSSSRTFTY